MVEDGHGACDSCSLRKLKHGQWVYKENKRLSVSLILTTRKAEQTIKAFSRPEHIVRVPQDTIAFSG